MCLHIALYFIAAWVNFIQTKWLYLYAVGILFSTNSRKIIFSNIVPPIARTTQNVLLSSAVNGLARSGPNPARTRNTSQNPKLNWICKQDRKIPNVTFIQNHKLNYYFKHIFRSTTVLIYFVYTE